MRDGNVPRFSWTRGEAQRMDPAGGVARGPAKQNPANRPAYDPAFLEMDSEKGREREREEEEKGWGGEEGYLFNK